mgnify:CR=1 FL=1
MFRKSDENPLMDETTPSAEIQMQPDVGTLKTPIRARDGRTMVLVRPSADPQLNGTATEEPFYLDRDKVNKTATFSSRSDLKQAAWEIMSEFFTLFSDIESYRACYDGIKILPRVIFWLSSFFAAFAGASILAH